MIDKREEQLKRETTKTLMTIIFSCIIFGIMSLFFLGFYKEIQKINPDQTKDLIIIDSSFIAEPKVKPNLKGLSIVMRCEKDYRKYFMSYKQYYTNSLYKIEIKEITFYDFMVTMPGDTLINQK